MKARIKELDLGCQVRQVRQDVVEGYAERMEAGDTFPPVAVVQEKERYFVWDGFHRVAAAERTGATEIEVVAQAGTKRDAMLAAVGANATNGVYRTGQDKRDAVRKLLDDPEWSQWSNCEIARQAVVSEGLVRKIRAEDESSTSNRTKWGVNKSSSQKRKTKDGRTMNVSLIGHPQHKAPDGCHICVPAEDEEISPEIITVDGAEAALYYGIDIRDGLRLLPDDSVHCVATSPPFWQLRDFGDDKQLGKESTLDEFVQNLVKVSREIRRVLRPDGIYWLELGDGFVRKFKDGDDVQDRRQCGLAEGNLIGVPWRVALALQADGWYLRSEVIWHKVSGKPEGNRTHRPVRAHDYLFILAPSAKAFWDAWALREPCVAEDGEKYCRTVWSIPSTRQPKSMRHPAPYPFELAHRMVLSGSSGGGCCPRCGGPYRRQPGSPEDWEPSCKCNAGDPIPCTVLDPFSGTATTGSAAVANGRNYIGIDLNADYLPWARERIRLGK